MIQMASELVNSATSSKLEDVDWMKNVEICELVARDHRISKDIVKAIKKRLGNKNANAQLYVVMKYFPGVPSTPVATATVASDTTAAQMSSSLVVASSSGTTASITPLLHPSCLQRLLGRLWRREWNSVLQERKGKFRKQANTVAEWDKRILHNRDVLLRLEIEVAKVVETHTYLKQQLELIETHHQEVDKALQSIEDDAERTYKDEREFLVDDDAASTRDAMYDQEEMIERELEQMTEQNKSIIQTMNANQGGELTSTDGMAPLDIVVCILNDQLSSLMWVDEKAEEFSSRIKKLATQGSASQRELMGPRY